MPPLACTVSNVISLASTKAATLVPFGSVVDPLDPVNSMVPFPVTDAVSTSPISASWTLSVPEIGAASLAWWTRNESGRDVFDLKCVGIAGVQDHAVEGMNADKFDVAVRVEYALVGAQEADDLRAGIGRNKCPPIVEGDGVRKIDGAPIQAKVFFSEPNVMVSVPPELMIK